MSESYIIVDGNKEGWPEKKFFDKKTGREVVVDAPSPQFPWKEGMILRQMTEEEASHKSREEKALVWGDPFEWVSKKEGYRFEHFRMSEIEKYSKDFQNIYNNAWQFHENFSPMDDITVQESLAKMKDFLDERFIWFGYVNDNPAAFMVCIPDVNQIIKHMHGNRVAPVDHAVCSPQPAIVTLPGNLLKLQILRLCP